MLHEAVTYFLFGLGVIALGVIFQKGFTFIRIAKQRKNQNLSGGANLNDPLAVVKLKINEGEVRLTVLRAHAAEAASKLEARLAWLAVIASAAPFIGLAGTVWGVMQALSSLTGANLNVGALTGPLSDALFATLAGLAAAIPAAIAYSLMTGRVSRLQEDSFLHIDKEDFSKEGPELEARVEVAP